MGAHIGNSRHLQQTLHGAVLPVFAVEDREYHIDPFPDHTVALKAQQALSPDRGDGSPAVIGMALPGTGGQQGVIIGLEKDPVALLGNANRENMILTLVNIVQDGLGGAEGNLMLRADTAKQNANA